MDLGDVTHTLFEPRLGETFRLSTEDSESVALELVEVTPQGQAAAQGGTRRAFSLLFEGPPDPVLPQRVYSIENEHLGRLELFLVPIGPTADRMRYEAVFN